MVNVKTEQTISNKPKLKIITFIILFFIIVMKFVNIDDTSSLDTNAPRQSPWDNSVDCVVYYLKHSYLRDPDSYEGIDWTNVIKNTNGTYQVTHTFRARNGFGGMNNSTLTFLISSDGWKIIDVY